MARSRFADLRSPFKGMDCPFIHETKREPEDRKPCPERYRVSCGCHKDGVPAIREHWKRPSI